MQCCVAAEDHCSFEQKKSVNKFLLGFWWCFRHYEPLLICPRWTFFPLHIRIQMACNSLQQLFQKVLKVKNRLHFQAKKLLLPLNSISEILLGCTILEMWIFYRSLTPSLRCKKTWSGCGREKMFIWEESVWVHSVYNAIKVTGGIFYLPDFFP